MKRTDEELDEKGNGGAEERERELLLPSLLLGIIS